MTDRVRTAYYIDMYVYLSHLAESTLPMCCINVILVYTGTHLTTLVSRITRAKACLNAGRLPPPSLPVDRDYSCRSPVACAVTVGGAAGLGTHRSPPPSHGISVRQRRPPVACWRLIVNELMRVFLSACCLLLSPLLLCHGHEPGLQITAPL